MYTVHCCCYYIIHCIYYDVNTEIGAQYKAHVIDIRRGDQFKPEFLAISPNNRIPAIVHHMTNESDGTVVDIPIFESGAILIHLAETYGRRDLLPGTDQAAKRSEVLKWLFWQVGGLGPMAGQMSHFFKFALTDEKDEEKKERRLEYGKERYLKETQRLFGVLDKQLEGKTFVTGDTLTIADMAIYPWVHSVRASHDMLQHFDQFSNVKRYTEHMGKLESVKHGMHVTPFPK